MREPRISPYSDDDRWAVLASLRGRYDVSYVDLAKLIHEAEVELVMSYREDRMTPGMRERWVDGSRLDWRVMLAELVEKLIKQ